LEKNNVEYLILLVSILLICIIVNLRYKLQIFQTSYQAGVVLFSLFVIGIVLDTFAVLRGYWSYNQNRNFFVGIKIGVLPVEEYLFMIVIPYLTLTIFGIVRKLNADH
jgi:lycopene cyclase domain-containing protein